MQRLTEPKTLYSMRVNGKMGLRMALALTTTMKNMYLKDAGRMIAKSKAQLLI